MLCISRAPARFGCKLFGNAKPQYYTLYLPSARVCTCYWEQTVGSTVVPIFSPTHFPGVILRDIGTVRVRMCITLVKFKCEVERCLHQEQVHKRSCLRSAYASTVWLVYLKIDISSLSTWANSLAIAACIYHFIKKKLCAWVWSNSDSTIQRIP